MKHDVTFGLPFACPFVCMSMGNLFMFELPSMKNGAALAKAFCE